MTRVERLPAPVLAVGVDVEVVPDDVDDARRVALGDRLHERDQVRRAAVFAALGKDVAGRDVEGADQREDAATPVLELVATELAGRRPPAGEPAPKRLDLGLLVDAEDRRPWRRVRVQVAHACGLLTELRIGLCSQSCACDVAAVPRSGESGRLSLALSSTPVVAASSARSEAWLQQDLPMRGCGGEHASLISSMRVSVLTSAGRPLRGRSSRRASARGSAAKRSRQTLAVSSEQPTRRAIAAFDAPAPAMSTMRARWTQRKGAVAIATVAAAGAHRWGDHDPGGSHCAAWRGEPLPIGFPDNFGRAVLVSPAAALPI